MGRVEFAINNAVRRATGYSPSEMLFGVEQMGEVIDEFTGQLLDHYMGEGEGNLH